MNQKLFELALDKLKASDWLHFEELASKFLVNDYPTIRTTASPSGDKGRDSELFSPDGKPNVVMQYSVSENWDTKIYRTIKRLKEVKSTAKIVIFLSNQVIGAQGDKRKATCLDEGYLLDIRDRNWFLERYEFDDSKCSAATTLVDTIARPYLEEINASKVSEQALTGQESKAALTYLGLQFEDENTEKGLTKIAFEALVRAALRDTDLHNRINRTKVYERIGSYIESYPIDDAKVYIDTALTRLTKKVIRHWPIQDDFCLMHSEVLRLQDKMAEYECEKSNFDSYIKEYLISLKDDYKELVDTNIPLVVDHIKKIIDLYLFKSGENFAASVTSESIIQIDESSLKDVIFSTLNEAPLPDSINSKFPDIAIDAISHIVTSRDDSTIKHLRKLSDSYTLFAFLREVPDVQSATKKIFSHGNIWIDTTVMLPLLGESIQDQPTLRPYTNIIDAIKESNTKLYVTDGVIREILNHIRIATMCAQRTDSEWSGRVPYLLINYIEMGHDIGKFKSWVENFRGDERPEDDLNDYLESAFGIEVKTLESESRKVDESLFHAVNRLWTNAHENRRNNHKDTDSSITDMLIKHDVESYLGIVALRKNESASKLGYKNWWLTIDSLAWQIRDAIKDEFKEKTPPSPLISLDFLTNNLCFGPNRSKVDRAHEQHLPVCLEFGMHDLPKEILDVAKSVREENHNLPEHLIQRKVRDACDKTKRRMGRITKSAISGT